MLQMYEKPAESESKYSFFYVLRQRKVLYCRQRPKKWVVDALFCMESSIFAHVMKILLDFLRNWTLPVAIASGIVAYMVFALVPALDGAAQFFAPIGERILPLFMFLILFVTFCKVDFRRLIPVRWMLWITAVQVVFVALLTLLVIEYRLQGNALITVEAVLTCIISPTAAAAPVVTAKLGGNLEQMTTYTFVSNFVTALLIPVCFPLIDKSADVSFISAFLVILREVCMVLVLPMALAYIVKHCVKPLHRRIVSVKDLSYYMWGGSLFVVSATTAKNIAHADTSVAFLLVIALLGLVLCIVQFAVGRFVGHYFGNTIDAGQALGQKNTTFAIWIAYTYLNPVSSIGPGCYILWQNIINSVEIWLCRKRLGHSLHT